MVFGRLYAPQWPGMIISHKKSFSYHDDFKSMQAALSTSSRLGAFTAVLLAEFCWPALVVGGGQCLLLVLGTWL